MPPDPNSFVETWPNDDDFLWKWWGLRVSGVEAHGQEKYFHARVGLCSPCVDVSMVELFSAVIEKSPPATNNDCDISPGYELVAGEFPLRPLRSPNSVLKVIPFETQSYLLTIMEGFTRPWKLLIEDPLVLLRIKREGWHLKSDSLVCNLVQKGLRFKVLYPACQDGTALHSNPGPVVHPAGRSPTHADYFTYRLEVAEFFKSNPHTHVAALCAGGILWRITVDVLPIPTEQELVRPFHPLRCDLKMIDGQRYWSPKLTEEEVETIIGVYKWPGESDRECGRRVLLVWFQSPSKAPPTRVGGQNPQLGIRQDSTLAHGLQLPKAGTRSESLVWMRGRRNQFGLGPGRGQLSTSTVIPQSSSVACGCLPVPSLRRTSHD